MTRFPQRPRIASLDALRRRRAARAAVPAAPLPGVSISVCPDGPLLVRGGIRLIGEQGEDLPTDRRTIALCRCGRSGLAPLCDGTHKVARLPRPEAAS